MLWTWKYTDISKCFLKAIYENKRNQFWKIDPFVPICFVKEGHIFALFVFYLHFDFSNKTLWIIFWKSIITIN